MATNKKTMDVIAAGILPRRKKPEVIIEQPEEDICPVIERIAQRAASDFTDMAINLNLQNTLELISYLESAQSHGNDKAFVVLMKCIFLAAGMNESKWMLELLDDCAKKESAVYEYFTDCFMETDEMDWFMMERILKDMNSREDMSESGGGYGEM